MGFAMLHDLFHVLPYMTLGKRWKEKAEDLKEKAEDLKEKLKRSVEELAAVKQAHVKFVSEVRSVAKTIRFQKEAFEVFTHTNILEMFNTIQDVEGVCFD